MFTQKSVDDSIAESSSFEGRMLTIEAQETVTIRVGKNKAEHLCSASAGRTLGLGVYCKGATLGSQPVIALVE